MRLSKRKDKLIRDIIKDVLATITGLALAKRPNNPQTLDVQPILDAIGRLGERIEEAVFVYSDAARVLQEQAEPPPPVVPSPIYPTADPTHNIALGGVSTGIGRLMIEKTGPGDDAFRLVAYFPSEGGPNSRTFRHGPRASCVDAWDDAVEWMKARLAEKWA